MGGCLALGIVVSNAAGADEWLEQSSWAGYFDEAQVQGVVVDQRHHQQLVDNHKRADERFSPASSFKVPHTLFALDAGIAKDEFQVFAWDGVTRWLPAWNQD